MFFLSNLCKTVDILEYERKFLPFEMKKNLLFEIEKKIAISIFHMTEKTCCCFVFVVRKMFNMNYSRY